MSVTLRHEGVRYLLALVVTAAVVLLRQLMDGVMADGLPLATLYGAVAFAVWFGGYRPALLAVVVGYLACNYLFIPPRGTLDVKDAGNLIGLLLYVLSCAIIIGFGESLRDAHRRAGREREFLRVTLSSMGDAVITTDPAGHVVSLNPVAVALTGWGQEVAAGRPLEEIFHIINEETRRPAENPVRKVLAEGRVVALANHTALIARDGTERPIDDSGAPIKNARGDVLGVVLIFRDVTQRRLLERLQRDLNRQLEDQVQARTAELRASEERFRLLVEGTKDYAIYLLDTTGRVSSWNPGAERIKQYRAKEVVGQHFERFYPPEDVRTGKPRQALEVAANEGTYEEEGWRVRKDGTRFWASVLITALRDQAGTLRGYSKVTRDITEKKQADENARRLLSEESARRAAEQYARLIEAQREQLRVTLTSIGDGVITTDAKGHVTLLNPVAEVLTGWTRGDAEGRPLATVFRIVNELTRNPVEDPVAKVLAVGQVVGLANHTVLISRDGTERPIDDSAAPIQDSGGQLLGAVLVFRDVSRRRREEATLLRQANLLEQAHDAMYVWELRGPVVYWNQAAEQLFGYTKSEVVGQGVHTVLGTAFPQGDVAAFEADLEGQGEFSGELSYTKKGGARLTAETRVRLVTEEDGRRYALATGRDVTERQAAEQALARERELLQTIFDTIPVMVTLYEPDTRVLRLNREFERLVGWSAQEAAGVSLMEECYPDPDYRAEVGRFMASDRGGWMDLRMRTRSGRAVETSWANVRLSDRTQVGIGIDITERKRAEDAVRHSEARLRLLWESASVLLSTNAPDKLLGDLFARIAPHIGLDAFFLYSVTETGDGLQLLASAGVPKDRDGPIARLGFGEGVCGTVAQRRQALVVTHVQASDDPKDRAIKELGIRAHVCLPLLIEDELLGTLAFSSRSRDEFATDELDFLRTICHYVSVVYERLRLISRLREADRRKDEFLATLAHELRNPLAPIRNAVELLRRAEADVAIRERARGMMERQLAQMVRLIDDLLDVSRISRGKVRLRRERVELAVVVRSALESVRPLVEARAHELTVTLPNDAVYLDADPTRLAQVIANLLNNAAKYTEKRGHIWLTAERQGREAVVSVRDNGIGLAPEDLSQIFEVFAQVDPALERSQSGLGIGLSLVRGLIQLHGGTVEAHSAGKGTGSEFIVRLPVAEPPASTRDNDAGQTNSALPPLRILVADDSRDAADSLSLMLRVQGHDVKTTYDGLEAVQAAATFRPEVALLDIGMPNLNGYDAARQLRAAPWGREVLLVAMTGWGKEEDKRRAAEAGFDHHLTKPVEPAALEGVLARFSSSKRS
jgi:PAS domain S-box-containing protein